MRPGERRDPYAVSSSFQTLFDDFRLNTYSRGYGSRLALRRPDDG